MRYVIESGVVRPSHEDPGWVPIARVPDPEEAYTAMRAVARVSAAGLYGPHGSRRLRVREDQP